MRSTKQEILRIKMNTQMSKRSRRQQVSKRNNKVWHKKWFNSQRINKLLHKFWFNNPKKKISIKILFIGVPSLNRKNFNLI